MLIYVRTLYKKLISIDCNITETVEQVKTKIYNQIGMKQDTQALFFKARPMMNQNMLSFYGVEEYDTLHIGLIQPKQRLTF
jgi:hypothetical protein